MGMASGPTSYSKPGIFDYGVDMYKGKAEAAKYGADATAGLNQYSQYANDTRNPGLAAQMQAAGFYRDQAMGKTPSLAEMQMQQGLGMAQRNTMQAATMGRGGNLAGQQQAAMSAGAGLAAQTNQQAAMLRAQEQQAAMAGLAGLGGQMYGQGMGYDQLAAQTQANNSAQMLDWYSARRGMDMQQSQNNWDRKMGLMNFGWGVAKDTAGMISGGMGGGLMSDERAKVLIVPSQGGISQAAAMATPVTYEYREGMGDGPGPRAGFTAQDLERTPLGPALVRDTPEGKMVDPKQAAMASLAGVAELRRDLDAMRSGGEAAEAQRRLLGPATPQLSDEERRTAQEMMMRQAERSASGASMSPEQREAYRQMRLREESQPVRSGSSASDAQRDALRRMMIEEETRVPMQRPVPSSPGADLTPEERARIQQRLLEMNRPMGLAALQRGEGSTLKVNAPQLASNTITQQMLRNRYG